MKLVVSILAITVMFLSTQCLIIDTNMGLKPSSGKQTCCSKKKTCIMQEEKENNKGFKEKEKTKDCKDACNPFMACCGCLYDGIPKNDFTINNPIASSVQNGNKENFFGSSYTSNSWRPPERIIKFSGTTFFNT